MATFFFSNGPSRKIAISNFAQNGKFLIYGGIAISRMYSIGDLWGSQTIRFNGILAGSDIKIIKTSDNTILSNITSATLNQETTIDWFYPPTTNNIQVIVTYPGYYFINTILDLEYSANKIIFLIDQIEVAVGVNVDDIADAVWDELMSTHTINGSYGVQIKKLLTLAKFLGLK